MERLNIVNCKHTFSCLYLFVVINITGSQENQETETGAECWFQQVGCWTDSLDEKSKLESSWENYLQSFVLRIAMRL